MTFPVVFMILVLTSGTVEVKQTTDQRCKSVVAGLAEGRVMLLENPDSGRHEGIQHAVCVSQAQLDTAGVRAYDNTNLPDRVPGLGSRDGRRPHLHAGRRYPADGAIARHSCDVAEWRIQQ